MISIFTKNIYECNNFQFVKFGDGELICMDGRSGVNCDSHPYSEELGSRLRQSFSFLTQLPNCYIGEWIWGFDDIKNKMLNQLEKQPKFVDYKIILNQEFLLTQDLYNFYKSIKYSKRKKYFIGNINLKGVVNFLNIDKHITIPDINCFSVYSETISTLRYLCEDDCIFIFSAGMMSKAIIHDLVLFNSNITCIDAGSAFDPIYYKYTRLNQPSMEVVREFYGILLK